MKITSIRAVPIRMPRLKTMYSAIGNIAFSEFAIVFVDTDEGVQGLGEVSMNLDRNGVSLAHDVNHLLAPALVGRDPRRIQELVRVMDQTIRGSEPAKCGIETALFDIAGKCCGVPVYQLLGGKMRDEIDVTWGAAFGDPDVIAEDMLEYAERGFKHFKLKTGRPGTGEDLATVRALRRKLGDGVRIRVDANCAYATPLEAVKELAPMEAYDLELIEQPLAGHRLRDMALVRSRLHTPLMADESMYRWTDALALVREEAADVLSVYISECGGLLASQKAFAIGEAAGMPALIGSQCEMGIAAAAQIHLAAAMPNLAYSSDVNGPMRYPLSIVNESFDYKDGKIRPFEAPGLGVTLNRDVFEQCRIDK